MYSNDFTYLGAKYRATMQDGSIVSVCRENGTETHSLGVILEARRAEFLRSVRAYAIENYDVEGWDYVVECLTDADILAVIGNATTCPAAVANVRATLAPLVNARDEVRNA